MGIALITNNILSDSGASLTGYVQYTGATANVELGVYDLKADSIYVEGSGGAGGALQLKQYSTAAINEIGYSSIGTLTSGVFYFTSSTTVPNFKNFVLNPSGLTDNVIRTYTLPDASGTIALTSNLSSYLPLSGGTLTGALNGTSATFSTLGTGTVYSNAGTLTNTNPSDSRLKTEIKSISYGLNEILKLRPVSYQWDNDDINQGLQFGFIAQEVQEIMPDAIKEFGEETKFLGLEKDAIYVTLVNAIKELKAELDTLKNK
jgi:hypothetical protein